MTRSLRFSYLCFFNSPFTKSAEPLLLLFKRGEKARFVTVNDVSKLDVYIVTHDFWMLVDGFRNSQVKLPDSVIDISLAARLLTGRPRSELHGFKPWEVWELVREYFADPNDLRIIRDIFFGKAKLPNNLDEITPLMAKLVESIADVWEKLLTELDRCSEFNRFFEIELPVYQVTLRRQYYGIRFDEGQLYSKLDVLDSQYYSNLKRLEFQYGYHPEKLEDKSIIPFLKQNNLDYLQRYAEQENFSDILDLVSHRSDFLSSFKSLKDSARDRNSLLKFGVYGEDRIYPVFDVMGTVTGRILVVDPLIQHLKRASRDIIISDPGMEFVYVDYHQFEPGILADVSADQHLIELYNSRDVYEYLGEVIRAPGEERAFYKKLFLAFSFGMERPGMVNLLSEICDEVDNLKEQVESFYSSFPRIAAWKEKLWNELLTTRKISSVCGNSRYRTLHLDHLASAEKRWAISQKVQGTASYILKKVILQLDKDLPDIDILVPMHDALLMQIDRSKKADLENEIERIFINNFKEVCPSITPAVTFSRFAE